MTDVNDACAALAQALLQVEGIAHVKPYPDDSFNPPEAQIWDRDLDPRLTLGGSPSRVVPFTVGVYVKRTDPRTAIYQLREFKAQTGTTSVVAVLEDDTNWPTGTQYVEVTNISQIKQIESGAAVYLSLEFDIDVCL